MEQRFEILGVTDERDSCDCCGRTGLKRTVALKDQDQDAEVVFFGTTCAARAMKVSAAVVRRGARMAQRAKDEAAERVRREKNRQDAEAFHAFVAEASGLGPDRIAEGILALGGHSAARKRQRESC